MTKKGPAKSESRVFRVFMASLSALVAALGIPALAQESHLGAGSTGSVFLMEERSPLLHVPRDYATIQAAVDAAAENNIVQVGPGLYNEKVVISKSGVKLKAAAGVVLDGTGFNGVGISVRGASAASPVSNVEVSGFEVRNFERGIVVEFAVNSAIHRNEVYLNVDKSPPFVLGDGAGIELLATRFSDVSQNLVRNNGGGGIQLRVGSTQNSIRSNRIDQNGTQQMADLGAAGIFLTGQGTHNNRLTENEIIGNYGRGIMLSRPVGTAPITGNLIVRNRVHDNYRSGIMIMHAAIHNIVIQNDARWNNISGLPPCYQCNLFEMSVGTNLWIRNLGTSNLTDACTP